MSPVNQFKVLLRPALGQFALLTMCYRRPLGLSFTPARQAGADDSGPGLMLAMPGFSA